MTFDDLKFSLHPFMSGIIARARFPNGYGASVIKGNYSYGGNDGLYELAVIKYNPNGAWNLCYDSGITEDVLGHLSVEDVTMYLKMIEELEYSTD